MPVTEASLNILDLHVSLTESTSRALRISKLNNNPSPKPEFVANDKLIVRVHLYEKEVGSTEGVLVARKFNSEAVVTIGAVPRQANLGTSELFISEEFTLVEDGDEAYYEAQVNAETDTMAALFASTNTAEIVVNLQVENAGPVPSKRKTFAYFFADALKDYLDGGEANPLLDGGWPGGDGSTFGISTSTATTGSSTTSSTNTGASTSESGTSTYTTTTSTNTYETTYGT